MTTPDTSGFDVLQMSLHARDNTPLESATDAQVSAAVRRLLDRHLLDYPDIDSEALMSAAASLSNAAQFGAPATAIEWLEEQPNEARFVIVSVLLSVSWCHALGPAAPDPALVCRLIEAYETLSYDAGISACLVITLIRAQLSGLPPTVAERVQPILESAKSSAHTPPQLHQMLKLVPSTPKK